MYKLKLQFINFSTSLWKVCTTDNIFFWILQRTNSRFGQSKAALHNFLFFGVDFCFLGYFSALACPEGSLTPFWAHCIASLSETGGGGLPHTFRFRTNQKGVYRMTLNIRWNKIFFFNNQKCAFVLSVISRW